jgi:hypothetical protein
MTDKSTTITQVLGVTPALKQYRVTVHRRWVPHLNPHELMVEAYDVRAAMTIGFDKVMLGHPARDFWSICVMECET